MTSAFIVHLCWTLQCEKTDSSDRDRYGNHNNDTVDV